MIPSGTMSLGNTFRAEPNTRILMLKENSVDSRRFDESHGLKISNHVAKNLCCSGQKRDQQNMTVMWKRKRVKLLLATFTCSLLPIVIVFLYLQKEMTGGKKIVTVQEKQSQRSFMQLPANISVFNVGMNSTEKNMLIDTLSVFITLMEAANLTYFLYGGSLLGALRHGGLIPWDDDVDVWINISQVLDFKKEISKLKDYKLYSPDDSQWKFYSIHGNPVVNTPYRWPYVDVYRFVENSTHISDSLNQYQVLFSYHKSDVFPLIKCNFESLKLNVPKRIKKIVTTNYDPEVCVSAKFDHRKDIPIRSQRHVVPCKHLSPYYRFGSYCG